MSKNKIKVLVLGSTGILGATVKRFLKKKVNLCSISRNKYEGEYLKDFTNFQNLKKIILKLEPKYIINCIGVTKFNKSINNKTETKKININLPIFLSNLCLMRKIYFVHISTDCVFSGLKGNYTENSKKDAKDLYGLSKSKSEVKNKFSVTIRTSFIGPELKTKKSLLNWFLSQKRSVRGFKNAFFSGLTSLELAKIIYVYFIKTTFLYNKIIHIGGKKISKYDLLKTISRIFNKKIKIISFFDFKIDRSLNSVTFKKRSKYKIKTWKLMIKELRLFMIKNNYNF